MIHHEEGIVEVSGGTSYSYEYFLKDHLGNTRVMFKHNNVTGIEVLQVADYYPFGSRHIPASLGGTNKYLFGGKELQDDDLGGVSLNVYDFIGRTYDPMLGRFWQIDPLAELSRRWSTYNYCMNNPMRFIDPDGMYAVTVHDRYGKTSWEVKTESDNEEGEDKKTEKEPPQKKENSFVSDATRVQHYFNKGIMNQKEEEEDMWSADGSDIAELYEEFGGKSKFIIYGGQILAWAEVLKAFNDGNVAQGCVKIGQMSIPYSFLYSAIYTMYNLDYTQRGIGAVLSKQVLFDYYQYKLTGNPRYEKSLERNEKIVRRIYYEQIKRK